MSEKCENLTRLRRSLRSLPGPDYVRVQRTHDTTLQHSPRYRSERPHLSQTMASQIGASPYHGHNNHDADSSRHRRVSGAP